jgi:hypothetical protein
MLDGPFVVRDRVGNPPLTQGEIANLVQQRNINVLASQFAFLDRPHVRGDRAIDLLKLLEFSRLLSVLCGVGHDFENHSGKEKGRPDDRRTGST